MNIIGKSIKHVTFGDGIIVNQNKEKVEINFGNCVKSFLYPSSFEKFIKVMDKKTENFIKRELEQLNEVRQQEEQEKNQLLHRIVTKGAHGVFDIRKEELSHFLSVGELSTGRERIRNSNTMIPLKIDMNSACILTMKEKEKKESERKIVGICMTTDDFIGQHCVNGIIPTEEKYRIMLTEGESIYFWSVFPEDKRKISWGTRKMKYVSTAVVEAILSRLFVVIEKEESRTKLITFEEYFNDRNVM